MGLSLWGWRHGGICFWDPLLCRIEPHYIHSVLCVFTGTFKRHFCFNKIVLYVGDAKTRIVCRLWYTRMVDARNGVFTVGFGALETWHRLYLFLRIRKGLTAYATRLILVRTGLPIKNEFL